MSIEVYNNLTVALLLGSLVALGLAVVYLAAALVGWKGPHRQHRLVRFAVLLTLFSTSVGLQQLLLYQVFVPALARENEQTREERPATSSVVDVGDQTPSSTLTDTARQHAQLEKERLAASSLVHVGDQAPSFRLTNTEGQEFVLDDLRGKVVVVNFFATWCGPCLAESPHVQKIWDEHHENSRFALIVIGREETTESINEFRSKRGYTFPMAPDPQRLAYSLYARQFIPRTFLVGADGKICFASMGFREDEFATLKAEVATQLQSIQ